MFDLKRLDRMTVFAACVLAGCLAPGHKLSPSPGESVETFRASARGFGEVAVTGRFFTGKNGRSSWVSFAAEDRRHAEICASKRLADLLAFGDLEPYPGKNFSGTVLQLDGAGAWLLGIEKATFHEIFARDLKALQRLAGAARARNWQAVPERAYPRWLDCFDNSGPGVWVGGAGQQYALPDDFEWLRKRQFAFCTLSPDESRLVAPGVVDTSIYDWHAAMAERYGLAYRILLFPHRPEWSWNRHPLPYVRPYPGLVTPRPFLNNLAQSIHDAFEGVTVTDRYRFDLRRRLATHLKSDQNLLGWHGSTEIPTSGILELASVAGTPVIRSLWHSYLVGELGLDLAGVGRLHRGDPDAYGSWEEVTVPTPLDFIGWRAGLCLDLGGEWEMRPDRAKAGADDRWYVPEKAPKDWKKASCNDPEILVYSPPGHAGDKKEKRPFFWMRRSFELPGEKLASFRYLHISRASWHGNVTFLFDVWINGKPLKKLSKDIRGDFDQCFEVGNALKPGANTIVMNTFGSPVPGYIFFNDIPLRRYPFMSETENRRWFDAINFDAWLRARAIENALIAQRCVDRNRPLKLMATIDLLDLTTRLCERYGAYQHDTGGAAGYWAPMTGARLARTHGLPWSCEPGGPPPNATALRAFITRYLMYGNDAMDLVFNVKNFRDKPDVAVWVDAHLDLMHGIGKLTLPLPSVGILRSTRASRLGFAEPWNWDVGRGALQAVGRNFAYAEVPDIHNGIIDRFKVLMDDGTILLTRADVEGLERYVRRGGIFIALHNTGQHLPSRANAWPISRLTGLKVTNRNRAIGGKLRFTRKQTLWPTLRAREINGWGMVLDWKGRDVTGESLGMQATVPTVETIAEWVNPPKGQGRLAVARRRLGRGWVITLGSTFWRDARDSGGFYQENAEAQNFLDELLNSLGVPRNSWTGRNEIWAEPWRSKNGLYDVYLLAHMDGRGSAARNVSISLRRGSAVQELVNLGEKGHPRVHVTWRDGRILLPPLDFEPLSIKALAAPRADLERAAVDWFRAQSALWRALPPVPDLRFPEKIAVPEDVVPLPDGWKMHAGKLPDGSWVSMDDAAARDWKSVKLGAFATMGLPEKAVAAFRKTVLLPKSWAGKRVTLVFDAEHWFWGINPYGRLWVNGKPASIAQPIRPSPSPGFTVDITEAARSGRVALALEIDGNRSPRKNAPPGKQFKPHGALGVFYLHAQAPPLKVESLAGPWFAARDFHDLKPVKVGDRAKYIYLETRFRLPATWPARRLYLASDVHLGWLIVNGHVLKAPGWMRRLDISGLVHRGGQNLLRWTPGTFAPNWRRIHNAEVPPLRLEWLP